MRRIKLLTGSVALFLLPFLVSAQGLTEPGGGAGAGVGRLLRNIIEFSNSVLIPFIVGIGFLVFVWGVFQYFIAGGASDDSKEKGKNLMIYATLGFLIIIVFWGIINLLADFTGLEGEAIELPKAVPFEALRD